MKMVKANEPCPCGSGVRFRDCCLPKMMMMGMAQQQEHPSQRRQGHNRRENGNGRKEDDFAVTRDDIMEASSQEKLAIAEKLISRNREDEAIEIFEIVLYKKEEDIDNIDLFFRVINYYKRRGNYERALLFCNELIKYDGHKGGKFSQEALGLKGELLINSGELQEGKKIFLELIEKYPDNLWNYYNLSNSLVESGFSSESTKYIEKGLALNTADPEKVKVLLRRILSKINSTREE
ncbi:MAG: SEC-C metal-binding domain-containing protein [Candidatus Eremiobacterota bacterium]